MRTGVTRTAGMTTVRTAALALAVGTMGLATLRSVAAPTQKAKPGAKKTAKAVPAGPSFARDVKALFDKECIVCHGKDSPSAGLNLARFQTETQAVGDLATIEKAMSRVEAGEMPPGRKLPPAQRNALQAWTQNALSAQCRLADPGRVTLRRLNREEYNNTVQDLLGITSRPADDFPGDDVGNGFDNQGDVLTISPLLMEKLLDTAEKLSREAVVVPKIFTRRFEGSEFTGPAGEGGGLRLMSTGVASKEMLLTSPGDYRLRIFAKGELAGPETPKLQVTVDGKPVSTFDVTNTQSKSFEIMTNIPAGSHKLGVEFVNDFYDDKTKADRNVVVDAAEVTGPLGALTYPPSHKKVIPFEPAKGQEAATARKFIAAFATKAFRRPATPQDLDRLMPVWEAGFKGGTFDEGMRLAVQACLSSPRFLFRLEQDPPGTKSAVRSLDSYEVASRLSYFLWSTMPDDELLGLAAKGQLVRPVVLKAQVKRMLANPKSKALADNFAGQWLQLRKLSIVDFDKKRFPLSEALRKDMGSETKLFFLDILQNGRSITDFIDGKYTYVNERLAKHYGMEGITGDEFRKIPLTGDRGGVLTQASILTVTSNPTRTSPTKRGKWVLENIFGTPPPPPPPGVSDLPDDRRKIEASTLRQLMEEHRKNPACAVCHQKMDPIGFGMENFDPIGRWRDKEGTFDVDSSGTLPGGKSFRGPTELKKILLGQKELFARALSEKMLTYALGREVGPKDRCSLDAVAATGYRLDTLVTAVVTSDPFLKRKGNAK